MGVYFVIGLSVVTAGAFAFSYFAGDFEGWRAPVLLLAWTVASGLSIWKMQRDRAKFWLSWNGHVWHLMPLLPIGQDPESHPQWLADCAMSVHLDLQRHLFVSVCNETGFRKWFWVSQNSFPDRWHGFRCAVYSRSDATPFH